MTITVDGIATRKVQVSKFAPNDTSADTTPYSVKILTGSVEIELRGNESELQEVATDSLSIGLTLTRYRSVPADTRSRASRRPSVCRAT